MRARNEGGLRFSVGSEGLLTRVSSLRTTITPDAGLLLLAGVNGWVVRLLAGDEVSLSLFGPLALSVALISICTAGGMGVAAIMEAA